MLLWIAFKFVSLYRMTQQVGRWCHLQVGCELLSNLYLCIGWHSFAVIEYSGLSVVNCFQICIFVSDDTAQRSWRLSAASCELLSNLYLCIGWHSSVIARVIFLNVVNCFQICIFVSDDTATIDVAIIKKKLWIAFKFVSLYRMTQLRRWYLH